MQNCTYRKVASSRLVYYSILNSLGQRSQYISIKFCLHKQSENAWVCYYPRQSNCSWLYGIEKNITFRFQMTKTKQMFIKYVCRWNSIRFQWFWRQDGLLFLDKIVQKLPLWLRRVVNWTNSMRVPDLVIDPFSFPHSAKGKSNKYQFHNAWNSLNNNKNILKF